VLSVWSFASAHASSVRSGTNVSAGASKKERPNLLEPVGLSVAETGAAMPTYRGTNHVAAQRGVKS